MQGVIDLQVEVLCDKVISDTENQSNGSNMEVIFIPSKLLYKFETLYALHKHSNDH